MRMKNYFVIAVLAPLFSFATFPKTVDGVTTIHLQQHNGHFAAEETLVGLQAGKYRFIVKNKAGKLVGFWLQDAKTRVFLERTPIEVGALLTLHLGMRSM